jgi:hypothetical protein
MIHSSFCSYASSSSYCYHYHEINSWYPHDTLNSHVMDSSKNFHGFVVTTSVSSKENLRTRR